MYYGVCKYIHVHVYVELLETLCSKETVRVHATVTEHSRTAKVIVFKKKRRKNYKRKRGVCVCVCVCVYVRL